jgi:hypothetical protein
MAARRFLSSRRALILTVALAAGLVRALGPKPPEPTLEGLSELLGEAVGGTVKNGDLAWEPSPGFLAETFRGRPVLFLASKRPGEPRDLYRAFVRVTLDGKPVSVERVRNLTETPYGDDTALETHGDKALFATLAFGRIQAISVLDLPGIRPSDRPSSLFDRVLLALSSFQETGSFSGIGRTDIVLDVPAHKATIELKPPSLAVDFGEQGRELLYDLERRVVRSAEGGEAYAARAIPKIHGSKPFIFWAVDTVRAEVGPGPIAWLENLVFCSPRRPSTRWRRNRKPRSRRCSTRARSRSSPIPGRRRACRASGSSRSPVKACGSRSRTRS